MSNHTILLKLVSKRNKMYCIMELKNIIAYYIDTRLEKSGYSGLRICRSMPDNDKDIFEDVFKICAQMESDNRFSGVLESFLNFGVSRDTFLVVLDQLLVGDLNWARVLSVVALSGRLAVQCAEHDEVSKIDLIQDWATSFADTKLGPWIKTNGGMAGLRQYFNPPVSSVNNWERGKVFAMGACGAVGVFVGLYVASKA